MKNKLLVSVFAVVIASLAFTSCESKSDAMDVMDDLIKSTIHKSARGLAKVEGQNLTIEEFEFLGNVNDDRLAYRTITYGNGTYQEKQVDTLRYEYAGWNENRTAYYLFVTPSNGEPYKLTYQGNALITSDQKTYGGESSNNVARVEKFESIIATFPNVAWEGTYEAEFVRDSVFRDSIRTRIIPPMTFITDTIQIFDHMDTISADTTCSIRYEFYRDPVTMKNTGYVIKNGIRSHYDREKKQAIIDDETVWECSFEWFFSSVSTDKKFTISAISKTEGKEDMTLNISAYNLDESGKPFVFTLGGITYKAVDLP